jgi:ketosteroid isomerase-like protein
MSEENVEIVRQGLENWNRGDLDVNFEYLDDDVVLRAAEGWPETAYRGKRELQSFYEGLTETVGGQAVIEELIDAGEAVVFRVRAHITGERSGLEICNSVK